MATVHPSREVPEAGTSSRIIVKHLPKHLTQDRLKAHFAAQKGPNGEPVVLTDCKLMRTQQGVSRRFAYLGYPTPTDAQRAVDHFNRTYLDTSRIQVELAKSMGDPTLIKRGERAGPVPQQQTYPEQKEEKSKEELADEAGFKEFLEVMKPRHKAQTWANDAFQPHQEGETAEMTATNLQGDEDDDEYQTLPTKTETPKETDVTTTVLDESTVPPPSEEAVSSAPPPPPAETVADQIRETGRLFLRNLSYRITEEALREVLAPFGPLTDFQLPMDAEGVKPKGFAIALFMFPEHAVDAWKALDGTIVAGRLMHVLPGRDTVKEREEFEAGFRGAKAKKLKDEASQEKIWNSLFMNANAVAKYIARTTGISKADLMTSQDADKADAGSAAVNLALAETHVIQETLTYLQEQGVDVEKLRAGVSGQVPRGKETLLIKGLPAEYADLDLKREVSVFGDLASFIIPPTRSIALVTYTRSDDAKQAFRGLAYKNFFGTPLKVEWAAADLFTTMPSITIDPTPGEEAVPPTASDPALTLFIKNLSFATTDAGLTDFLSSCKGLRTAKVTYRTDPKKPGMRLSTGFGFAEFDEVANAQQAILKLQNKYLDGHAVQLDFARGRSQQVAKSEEEEESKEEKEEGGKPTKVIVRNVAFETKPAEIRALFANFGTLKSVRLPKKQDRGLGSEHRGFAFVDFGSHQDALRAMKDMAGTHLYGRRLVMEFAKTEDIADPDVTALRETTKRKYREEKAVASKVSLENEEEALEKEDKDGMMTEMPMSGDRRPKKSKRR